MKEPTTTDKDRPLRTRESLREELAVLNDALRKAHEDLQAAREQFTELFELTPAGYADLDGKGRIVRINQVGALLIGISRAQLVGKPLTAFVARDSVQEFLDHIRQCLKEGTGPGALITLSAQRGAERHPVPVKLSSVAIKQRQTTVIRTAFLELPRKEEEEEEAAAHKRAAQLGEFSPVALSHLDLREIAARAAALAAQNLGACFVEVLESRPGGSVLWPVASAGRKREAAASAPADDWPYAEVLQTRQPVVLKGVPGELTARAPHLTEARVTSGVAVLVPADPARPYGVMAAYSEVRRAWRPIEIRFLQAIADVLGVAASRRRMEATLKESEERFRSLVANSLAGFFIVQDGKIIFMNPEQVKIFGALPLPCDLEAVERLVHKEDRQAFRRLVLGKPAPPEPGTAVSLRFVPGGNPVAATEILWTHSRAAQVKFSDRDAVLVNTVDVTRAREMEQIAASSDKLASLGQLAAGMAHEIRNPLSGINLYVDSLERFIADRKALDEADRTAARRIVEALRANSGRIETVIERVMGFSRPRPPKFHPSDLNRCVEAAIDLSMMALRRKGVRVRTDLAAALPAVNADPRLIEQVLLNLLTNAGHAVTQSERSKEIEVVSRGEEGKVVIRVGDSGAGVPEAIRDRIFSPFFTTKREGTGIGLALSHRVIAEHSGSLTVGTSHLGGAEFRIELPVVRDRAGHRGKAGN